MRTDAPAADLGWALVTGASSGIGRAVAEQLALGGRSVVLVARTRDALLATADVLAARGVRARVVALDLGDPAAVDALDAATADLDVALVVHAAGEGLGGPFEAGPLDRQLAMVDVHARSTVALSHRFVSRFRRRVELAFPTCVPRGSPVLVDAGCSACERGIMA